MVATAPTNAPTLAQAMNAAPQAAVAAPTAQDAQPHGMTTEQQIQNWIADRTPGASFDEAPAPGPQDDRQMHGMVEAESARAATDPMAQPCPCRWAKTGG